MKSVGVRELKANISELLQAVYATGETVEVTRHGQVIARLVPACQPQLTDRDANGAWTELNKLAAEISALWPDGVSAQDAVDDVRRDI
ncbi:MAG TPA: type II toxin-antitoxin system prevent-host-death family antitoxin [Chloroflexia bacterium]|jgi:prevent-host-death family protein